jgi:PhzF family phenazine biosynthesis protein
MRRTFKQVDVFGSGPHSGNPVAVVLDAEGLGPEDMQRFARWTNLSETTFVSPPSDPGADYRVRIFTTDEELPFAGHPTLGTCHAWLEAGGVPRDPGRIVQECGAGLVPLRRDDAGRLAFAAPPLLRSGPVEEDVLERVVEVLAISRDDVVDAEWCDNGPRWIGVLLRDADAVLAVRPRPAQDLNIGIAGPHPAGGEVAWEVRTFFEAGGTALVEDPITGSFNAALAQWLLRTGRASAPYVAAQGTAIARRGRIHVSADAGDIWIAGDTVTLIDGEADVASMRRGS